jgi:hypothetical protein
MRALEKPGRTVVANVISIALEYRPTFLQPLLHRLLELRTRTGRPHWIVMDEAHHIFPHDAKLPPVEIPAALHTLMFVTVDPQHVHRDALRRVNMLLVVGKGPDRTIRDFCAATGHALPNVTRDDLPPGFALTWRPGGPVLSFRTLPAQSLRRRHVRKYAQGELNEHDSFYFRGPDGKLRLRAQNLQTFMQLADGVDDATWQFHRHEGAYSRWIRTVLKDADLADAVAHREQATELSASASRQAIRQEIESRYTAAE